MSVFRGFAVTLILYDSVTRRSAAGSDSVIAAAPFSLPLTLLYFLTRQAVK
jgi:hypothetical protein